MSFGLVARLVWRRGGAPAFNRLERFEYLEGD